MTSSENALEQLVSQFSQPLAFLRELIQNSMDAGATLIEVEVNYQADSKGCVVSVKDNGHGMNREIIDQRLTKLFSSTKENDFTKIGKFGIGFVSIFAVKPQLVVLETGQDGEAWRLLFLPDRSFERRELSHPVEGTSVTVITNYGHLMLDKVKEDCLETITFWCKHSDVEIVFNGTPINQEFDLPGASYQFRHKVDGTEVVLAPGAERQGFHGYYNRGLTLLEGHGSPFPWLNFKIRSRYLEHTLSRDNILHDQNYLKAMAEVKLAAYSLMPRDLIRQCAETQDLKLWDQALLLLRLPSDVLHRFRKMKAFPSNGKLLALAKLPQQLYYASEVDPLWEAAEREGATILLLTGGPDDPRVRILLGLDRSVEPLRDAFFHYQPATELSPEEDRFLRSLGPACRHLAKPFLVDSLNTPQGWKPRFCAYLHPSKRIDHDPNQGKRWREGVGIRREHPLWEKLVCLHQVQPELALSLAARTMGLELQDKGKSEGKLFHNLVKSLRAREATA